MAAKVDSLSWLVTWLQNWISFGIIYFERKFVSLENSGFEGI